MDTIQAFWRKPSAAAAAILLLTAPAFQSFSQSTAPRDLLTITENSSTSLTATWTTSSGIVSPLSWTLVGVGDHWTVTLPVGVTVNMNDIFGGAAIPEAPGDTWNIVTTLPARTFQNTVDVQSDAMITFADALEIPPGTIGTAGILASGVPFNLEFIDLGDEPDTGTVPDGASTALLALPAILALFAVARLRKSSVLA